MIKFFSNRILKTLVLVFVFFVSANFVYGETENGCEKHSSFTNPYCSNDSHCPGGYCLNNQKAVWLFSSASKRCKCVGGTNNSTDSEKGCIKHTSYTDNFCSNDSHCPNGSCLTNDKTEWVSAIDSERCRCVGGENDYQAILATKDADACAKGYFKMVFGLPFSNMRKNDCVPLDTGIPNLINICNSIYFCVNWNNFGYYINYSWIYVVILCWQYNCYKKSSDDDKKCFYWTRIRYIFWINTCHH